MSDTGALLEVADLNAWYGESHVLHGVDLEVRRGETVTLLGRNGVGKSTTLRAIMGIVRKRTGTIRFDGQDLMALALHRTAHAGIGFVPEERGIFATLTVQENLMLPPVVAEGGMSVEEIFQLFPNLKERRASPGTRLSGGEQQMLAIGRCLMGAPRLIMFDEPSLGLAPALVGEVLETIGDLHRQGITILLVEQNVAASLKLASRAYVLETGSIVLEGSGVALLEDPRVREAYLGL
jgi:branched-chain amino acid transport system ATP-binding protein